MKQTSLSMGQVSLNVIDLSRMKDFYHETLGLDVISTDEKLVTLGEGAHPLIVLHAGGHLPIAGVADAGLYHFALVFAIQHALAKRVEHILRIAPHHFSGSADHLVSEAFYFTDPEGNGIELYFDRDRKTWQWENGSIKMATLYIDPIVYIQMHTSTVEKISTTRMGHVHLKVGDIEKARAFYADILGFDVTAQLPGALFISVDGYHHHIGLNSWESAGAGKRMESVGLRSFELMFGDTTHVEAIVQRLQKHAVPFEKDVNGITLHDPWHNRIRII